MHGWLGLNLGLLLFVICFSGTFAVFSSDVDWLINRDMRNQASEEPVQWQKMYESIAEAYPEGNNVGMYKETYAGHGDHFASVAYVSLPNGQVRKVYMNPHTGKIQGDTSFYNTQRFFRSLHRRFFDGNLGIFLVTIFSIPFFLSVLSGFLFYKGWLKNLFKLRLKQGVKRLWSDLHKLLGIWSLVFALIIALTGIFYFAELMILASENEEVILPERPPPITETDQARFGANPRLPCINSYIQNAEEAFPGMEIQTLRVPDEPDEYVYVDGTTGNPITRNRANRVYLHPFTAEVVHVQKASDLNAIEFITDIADPFHFGYFGGFLTKILWFLFGLAISFSILSGTYLWYIKSAGKLARRSAKMSKSEYGEEQSRGLVKKLSDKVASIPLTRGATISTLIILAYLVHIVFATIDSIRSYGPAPVAESIAVDTLSVGSWQAGVYVLASPQTPGQPKLQARFHTEGIPNFKSAEFLAASDTGPLGNAYPLNRDSKRPPQYFKTKSIQSYPEALSITITDFDGHRFKGEIDKQQLLQAKHRWKTLDLPAYERSYPQTTPLVWIYIGLFVLLTVATIIAWLRFLIRMIREKYSLALEG